MSLSDSKMIAQRMEEITYPGKVTTRIYCPRCQATWTEIMKASFGQDERGATARLCGECKDELLAELL